MNLHLKKKALLKFDIKRNEDLYLKGVSTLKSPNNQTLVFIKKRASDVENLKKVKSCFIIAYNDVLSDYDKETFKNHELLVVENPRLVFIKVLTEMMSNYEKTIEDKDYLDHGLSRYIHKSAKVHKSVIIRPDVVIDSNVEIKKNTILNSGVHIKSNVIIGEDCAIGSGTVIGNQGFGAERDVDGKIYMMPHIGGVTIGDRVFIGSNTTIVSGTINPTIIKAEVKIDDLSVIAHNCIINRSVILCGGSSLGGSVEVGDCSWIGSATVVKQSVKIGSNVTTGIGSVVMRNIKSGETVLGNPSEEISKFMGNKRKLRKLK